MSRLLGYIVFGLCILALLTSSLPLLVQDVDNDLEMSPLSPTRLAALTANDARSGLLTSDTKDAAALLLERNPRHALARAIVAFNQLDTGDTDRFVLNLRSLNTTDPNVTLSLLPQILNTASVEPVFVALRPELEDETSAFGEQASKVIAQIQPERLAGEAAILRAHPEVLSILTAHYMSKDDRRSAEDIYCRTVLRQSACGTGPHDPTFGYAGQNGDFGWQVLGGASVTADGIEIILTDDAPKSVLTQRFYRDADASAWSIQSRVEPHVGRVDLTGQLACADDEDLIWSGPLPSGEATLRVDVDERASCDLVDLTIFADHGDAGQTYSIAALSELSFTPDMPSP